MDYRIGHGYDLHRLESGTSLIVGGVRLDCGLQAIAHSDGDAVLHAIADAIYSAIGDGDIGSHFPNTDDANSDADSKVFIEDALNRCSFLGWSIVNVSVTVICDAPKINVHRSEITSALAAILNAPVHIKGKTTESVKEANAIEVHVVALLQSGTSS